jgi:hypothetical protein
MFAEVGAEPALTIMHVLHDGKCGSAGKQGG